MQIQIFIILNFDTNVHYLEFDTNLHYFVFYFSVLQKKVSKSCSCTRKLVGQCDTFVDVDVDDDIDIGSGPKGSGFKEFKK